MPYTVHPATSGAVLAGNGQTASTPSSDADMFLRLMLIRVHLPTYFIMLTCLTSVS